MAEPKKSEEVQNKSDVSGADHAFPEQSGQDKAAHVDVGDSLASQAFELKTIGRRFVTRVLPILLIPLLLLGGLAIAGLTVLGSEASTATNETDIILEDHQNIISEDLSVDAASGTTLVNSFLIQWYARVERIDDATTSASEVSANMQEATGLAGFDGLDAIQVLFVDRNGRTISSSSEGTLPNYGGAEWFDLVQETDQFRPFVFDSEFTLEGTNVAAFEFSRALSDGNFGRFRIPFSQLHAQLDRAVARTELADGIRDFDYAIGDTAANVLIADTSIANDPAVLFTAGSLSSENTSFNDQAIVDAMNSDGERQASMGVVLDGVSTDRFPFTELDWEIQATVPLDDLSTRLISFQDTAESVNERQRILTIGIALIMIATAIGAFFLLRNAAQRISEPVTKLSAQAQEAAEIGIPQVVEASRNSDELPELEPFEVETDDELAILAASLNTMQNAAVDLAAGQAQLRRQNVARTFVSLGRRNQNLLNRQLEFIEELEATERDADTLENLFRLDHLATRMRRNAENLLVLAGEQTPRRWGKPIAVRDVLRAAASEIADYRRVRLGDVEEATVSGNLATDLSHLIAELLENAGSFSPPTAPIEVFGLSTETHYRLAIVDQGIGMDEASLAQVNERLENPVDFADAPSAYLGLFVVGRLAGDMGVSVRLANADANGDGERRGTIAFIDLPNELLTHDVAAAVPLDEKASEAVARRTTAVDEAQDEVGAGADVFAEPSPKSNDVDAPQPVTAEEAPAAQVVPEPEAAPVAKTEAGFAKRSKGATSIKTEPDKLVSNTPATAEPATEAEEAQTEAGFAKRKKGATSIKTEPDKFVSSKPASVEPEVASTEVADVVDGPTTGAGFTKRKKGATSIKSEPDKFVSSTPASVEDEAPRVRDPKNSAIAQVNKAKAEAKAAAAAEKAAKPEVEATSAGFPKRSENKAASPLPAANETSAPKEQRKRSAEDVRNSLAAYRAAVARGRGDDSSGEMPDAVAASPDQQSNS